LVEIEAVSPVYETRPWGISDQPTFLNACIAAGTATPPIPLLSAIKTVEVEMGRESSYRWGPRLIDIDILFYDKLILKSQQLTVPHPHVARRGFVLAPLADIFPDFRHPENGRSVAEMLADVDTSGVYRLQEPLFPNE
jgi:2-amino-4-hydroxy-6-hydroxymethyldihydropteridine diphosphokinase